MEKAKHRSYWIESTPKTDYPVLEKNIIVDVAIVGGGITGLTAASILKDTGKTVAVIEADRIAENVTGHTTAKITSQHGLIYSRLFERFGWEKTILYGEASQAALEHIAMQTSKKKISCDFIRTSAYVYTENKENIEILKKEAEVAQKAGLPALFVKETPLPFDIECAIRFDNQAQFHPRKYLLALAQEIDGNGSFIFENTRAIDLQEDKLITVSTDHGGIKAEKVIMATHFPFADKGFFYARLYPYFSYVLGMRVKGKVPEGMYYSEDDNRHSIRSQPTKNGMLLLVGGGHHKTGQAKDTYQYYQNIRDYTSKRFDVESTKYYWSTQDYFTTDGIPYIGKSPKLKHAYLATGYGKWGMTNGTLAGMILAGMILDRPDPWQTMFDPSRFNIAASSRKLIVENVNVMRRFTTGRIKKTKAPKCTHMYCVLTWNDMEKTWDCPCHGSRFNEKGEIIHGPALARFVMH